MLSFDPSKNTNRENYKTLTSGIVPRPIAFITSLARDRTVNAAPFSYFNAVTNEPPTVAIAIQRKSPDVPKDTARNILENKEFVVHIVDEEIITEVDKTAAELPPNESEVDLTNLTLTNSSNVSVPGIKEAKVRFECVLDQAIELKVRNEVESDLILGRVIRYHIDNDLYTDGHIDHAGLKPVGTLGRSNYTELGNVFSYKK